MEYIIHPLLDTSSAKNLLHKLLANKSSWQSGKISAGQYAAEVKNNFQLDRDSEEANEMSNYVIERILKDALLKSFTLPRKVHGVMFTSTRSGQGYGTHVDNAYMSTGRSDLSFTLFLSNPSDYEGGELSFQTIQDRKQIKLKAGEIIIYPSTSLHSVEPVNHGERLVCVGWIQSYIANNDDRNMLFGLDAGARGLLAQHGRSPELDLVFQAYSNLLRRLGD